jgi:spore coat polysaccharide biosynthesis predicted glycosyltransferase SpsG
VGARPQPRGGSAGQVRGLPPGGVLFRTAGSAHIGYGHVVRALHLAAALGVPARVSIRGTVAAIETARRLGARVDTGSPRRLVSAGLRLLVIDDPSAAAGRPWLRAARRAGVPVVSIHDRGIAPLASDLAVDGSLSARPRRGLGRAGGVRCLGASFAVLAGGLARRTPEPRSQRRPTIVISLGGGRHAAAGRSVAAVLQEKLDAAAAASSGAIRSSRARVLLSLGLDIVAPDPQRLRPAGVEVIAPARLRAELARASLAVVAGGTTLYEACALGTPAVAVAVVAGQSPTVASFARAGLVAAPFGSVTGPRVGSAAWGRIVAEAAWKLWEDASARQALGSAGRGAIDGHGARRVAQAIARLLETKREPTA